MARVDSYVDRLAYRFPRPRGDGPEIQQASKRRQMFSPPTRGWPGLSFAGSVRLSVFPAHAGMARVANHRHRYQNRFPRPRGDGPENAPARNIRTGFSPPTRGWPAERAVIASRREVFPAHAGMARRYRNGDAQLPSFPRPRGDGPRCRMSSTHSALFSPPTRGWPGERLFRDANNRVFPAHAGMARCCWRASSLAAGFPRPRGDGPHFSSACSASLAFSPPTRGWPGQAGDAGFTPGVFPAHAGMARRPPARPPSASGFPRPRGDGPGRVTAASSNSAFSPPTRGWPAGGIRQGGHGAVFPAHAGMAREDLPRAATPPGFPRPRGDGPLIWPTATYPDAFSPPTRGWPASTLRQALNPLVFPAHAGMARFSSLGDAQSGSFPRPRGDGPIYLRLTYTGTAFSPPTRGWPAPPFRVGLCGVVFPAHAGMARSRNHFHHAGDGFPRPRGDGPARLSRLETARLFSPPTRGWPVRHRQRRHHRQVFPAHAGMARRTGCSRETG